MDTASLSLVQLVDAAQKLESAGCNAQAVSAYRSWLSGNAEDPSSLAYVAEFNLAVLLSQMNDTEAAEASFRSSTKLNPSFWNAHLGLTRLLQRVDRVDDAIFHWYETLAHVEGGNAAQVEFDSAFREHAWQILAELLRERASSTTHGYAWTRSLAANPASDMPEVQAAMTRHALDLNTDYRHPMSSRTRYAHTRVRVAYLAPVVSADLSELARLTQSLAKHDRARFEIVVLAWTPDSGISDRFAAAKQELLAQADRGFDIDALTDEQAACLIRSQEVDILVDCADLSLCARPGIVNYRPAPLQMVWSSMPLGAARPEIDYVLVDVPPLPTLAGQHEWMDKAVHIPRQRPTGKRRRSAGGKHDAIAFVFAGDPLQATPLMRETWIRILQRTPESQFYIAGMDEETYARLSASFVAGGVEAERIHFAPAKPPGSLSRAIPSSCLFLDTFPSGCTQEVQEMLCDGVPVLTVKGRCAASRVNACLLEGLGLGDLVADDLSSYENKAVEFATNTALAKRIRQTLTAQQSSFLRDDTVCVSTRLEAHYHAALQALPPRPEKPKYKPRDLAYLRPLIPSSPGHARSIVQGRVVIAAPPYQHNSAGIRVLYNLQRWLVCAGVDAMVCTWFQGYPVEQFRNDIVIYPEVAPGNLLRAKRVVRYILNTPGKLGHGESSYAPEEVLVAYNRQLAPYADGVVLQVPVVEEYFNAQGDSQRTNDAFYVGKGKNLCVHPDHCVEITKTYPETRLAMAAFLKTVDTLYTYDDFTMLAIEAQLCGCKIQVIKPDASIVPYVPEHLPSEDEFRVQLHEFIELLKTL